MHSKTLSVKFVCFFNLLVLLALVATPQPALAQADPPPPNPYDLIASVNALRNSRGLGSLRMDGSLMAAAQQQADDLAAGLAFGHTGPGGTSADDRARMNGYPFYEGIDVMECWASAGSEAGVGDIVYGSWGDEVHTNVMIHAYARDVGAGIAVDADGRVYYVLDVGADYWGTGTNGRATATSLPGWMVTPGGPTLTPALIFPVFTATPQPDGSLKHHVEPGQTLWSIAIAYEMKLEDLTRLNGLDAQNPVIYAGQDLLIRQVGATTSSTPVVQATSASAAEADQPNAPASAATASPTALQTKSNASLSVTPLASPSATATQQTTPAPINPKRITGLLLLLFCVGGLLMVGWSWFKPRANS